MQVEHTTVVLARCLTGRMDGPNNLLQWHLTDSVPKDFRLSVPACPRKVGYEWPGSRRVHNWGTGQESFGFALLKSYLSFQEA